MCCTAVKKSNEVLTKKRNQLVAILENVKKEDKKKKKDGPPRNLTQSALPNQASWQDITLRKNVIGLFMVCTHSLFQCLSIVPFRI